MFIIVVPACPGSPGHMSVKRLCVAYVYVFHCNYNLYLYVVPFPRNTETFFAKISEDHLILNTCRTAVFISVMLTIVGPVSTNNRRTEFEMSSFTHSDF